MRDTGAGPDTPAARTTVDVCVRTGGADPVALWRLLSTPALWPTWAPHIRGAAPPPAASAHHERGGSHDGASTVRAGDVVRIDGHGPVAVTARIALVDAPRRWDFVVPLPLGHQLSATHELVDAPARVCVRMALHGPLPSPLGTLLLRAYQPLATVAVRRLVAHASGDGGPPAAPGTERTER